MSLRLPVGSNVLLLPSGTHQLCRERTPERVRHTSDVKKMENLRIAAKLKVEKARLAAANKAKRASTKMCIYLLYEAVYLFLYSSVN